MTDTTESLRAKLEQCYGDVFEDGTERCWYCSLLKPTHEEWCVAGFLASALARLEAAERREDWLLDLAAALGHERKSPGATVADEAWRAMDTETQNAVNEREAALAREETPNA